VSVVVIRIVRVVAGLDRVEKVFQLGLVDVELLNEVEVAEQLQAHVVQWSSCSNDTRERR